MAIITNVTLESGLEVQDSYARIELIQGDKTKLTVGLFFYVNQQAIEGGKDTVTRKYYDFVPADEDDSVRWDKQAYEYLKALPEFAEAVDA
ncbi:hypothetical protein [Cohnella sp. 56]|uniref:hypothetical protein n=1 Tax=Cohnella sp. 56 TaxID=3113722 RepID=UPI0030E824AD